MTSCSKATFFVVLKATRSQFLIHTHTEQLYAGESGKVTVKRLTKNAQTKPLDFINFINFVTTTVLREHFLSVCVCVFFSIGSINGRMQRKHTEHIKNRNIEKLKY